MDDTFFYNVGRKFVHGPLDHATVNLVYNYFLDVSRTMLRHVWSFRTQKGIDDTSATIAARLTHHSLHPRRPKKGKNPGTRTHARTYYAHIGPRINPSTPKRLTWIDLEKKGGPKEWQ